MVSGLRETLTPSLFALLSGRVSAPLLIHFLSYPLNFSGLTHFPCQLQEAADHDPFQLFNANLKRDLAGEQPYRRALSESEHPAGIWEAGRLGLCTEGARLRDRRAGVGRDLLGAISFAKDRSESSRARSPRCRDWEPKLRALRAAEPGNGAGGDWLPSRRPGSCSSGPLGLWPSPGCLDMLSLPGQFTFTADRPQLHCAAFFIGEPEEFITIHYDLVSIDCQGGDFLKVRRPAPCIPSPEVGRGWRA